MRTLIVEGHYSISIVRERPEQLATDRFVLSASATLRAGMDQQMRATIAYACAHCAISLAGDAVAMLDC
jgi:hypothetical protein